MLELHYPMIQFLIKYNIIPFQSAAVKKRRKKQQSVLPYLIITSAPAGGSSESIFLCVLASVKSHLDKIVAPRMSSMSS